MDLSNLHPTLGKQEITEGTTPSQDTMSLNIQTIAAPSPSHEVTDRINGMVITNQAQYAGVSTIPLTKLLAELPHNTAIRVKTGDEAALVTQLLDLIARPYSLQLKEFLPRDQKLLKEMPLTALLGVHQDSISSGSPSDYDLTDDDDDDIED